MRRDHGVLGVHAAAARRGRHPRRRGASDHVIESFRNDLWPGYKTSAGMPPELLAQIPVVEEALVGAWASRRGRWSSTRPTTRSARRPPVADADERVEQVLIVTPDKDLGQCVRGSGVVQSTGASARSSTRTASSPSSASARRRSPTTSRSSATRPTASPASPGWGAKSAAAVLARYGPPQDIPPSPGSGGFRRAARGGEAVGTLRDKFELALLFRRIATVETDVDVGTVDDWQWSGPTDEFAAVAEAHRRAALAERAKRLAPSELHPPAEVTARRPAAHGRCR